MKLLISQEKVENKIFLIRGKKVMIDFDLAEMYGVSTKRLNEQVKRNLSRFPKDFMFRLTKNERSELVAFCDRFDTLKHSISMPFAFTEPGVAMLSSVLNSERSIKVNIEIIRTFIRLREYIQSNKEFAYKLNELESKVSNHDKEISSIFNAIRQLMKEEKRPKRKVGFSID